MKRRIRKITFRDGRILYRYEELRGWRGLLGQVAYFSNKETLTDALTKLRDAQANDIVKREVVVHVR